MAPLFTDDGGDSYQSFIADAWTNSNGAQVDASGLNSRTGVGAIECTDACPFQAIPNGRNFFAGLGFKVTGFPGGNSGPKPLGFAYNNSYPFLAVYIQTNGTAGLDLVGGAGIAASSAPGILTAGLYAYVELGIALDGAGGCIASVRVNGSQVIGPTTLPLGFGATTVNTFSPGISGAAGATMWLDDIYINDGTGAHNNGFEGPIRVYWTVPNADLAPLNWTPSTGLAHFSLVNSVPPPSGATYVEDQNVGDIDQYAFPLPSGMGAVQITGFGVRLLAEIGSAGARSIGAQIGGNASAGSPLTTSYNYVRVEYSVNPLTGLPLKTSDFPLPCGPVVTA